jgi:hypothetical protein
MDIIIKNKIQSKSATKPKPKTTTKTIMTKTITTKITTTKSKTTTKPTKVSR